MATGAAEAACAVGAALLRSARMVEPPPMAGMDAAIATGGRNGLWRVTAGALGGGAYDGAAAS